MIIAINAETFDKKIQHPFPSKENHWQTRNVREPFNLTWSIYKNPQLTLTFSGDRLKVLPSNIRDNRRMSAHRFVQHCTGVSLPVQSDKERRARRKGKTFQMKEKVKSYFIVI